MSSYAYAGWLGYAEVTKSDSAGLSTGSPRGIRFTTEGFDIPQSQQKLAGLHVGQRNSGAYSFKIIRPTGSITFPLLTADITSNDDAWSVIEAPQSSAVTPHLDPVGCKMLMVACQPYTGNSYPPSPTPNLGSITLYRGDMYKSFAGPWINTMEVSGSADSDITCNLGFKCLRGTITKQSTAPSSTLGSNARALHFNELVWGDLTTDFLLEAMGGNSLGDSDTQLRPRNFSLSINNNLQDDDSYNPANPLSLLGFTFGEQDISCNFTFVGGYVPKQDEIITGIGDASVNVGGLFSVNSGIWTSKSLIIPGPSEIAVTTLTLTGLTTSTYIVQPSANVVAYGSW